nr:uncharacterized protein LOC129270189 [Lytechinus pictus]
MIYKGLHSLFLSSDLANNLKRLKHRPEHKRWLTVNWFKGFLERWPTIRLVKPQSLSMSPAKSSKPQNVRDYYKELERILKKYNLQEKPSQIFNVDEVGFNGKHRPVKIMRWKSCHRPVAEAENLRENGLPGTLVEVSESGWSNSELFLKFMKEHFLPYMYINGRTDGEPVMLIYDGHKSHVSVPVLQMARTNIMLFVLPAHTSQFLQTLDVGAVAISIPPRLDSLGSLIPIFNNTNERTAREAGASWVDLRDS